MRTMSFIMRSVLGPNHVMEDGNPIPKPFRAKESGVVGSTPVEPVEAGRPIDSVTGETPQPQLGD